MQRLKKALNVMVSILLTVSVVLSCTLISQPVSAATTKNKIEVGDEITLGTYNGAPIVWVCILVDDNGPLMLAKDVLCQKAYDAEGENEYYHAFYGSAYWDQRYMYGSNCWSDSNIRQWLNTSGKVTYTHCAPAYSSESGFMSNFTTAELSKVKTVTQRAYLNLGDLEREGYISGGTEEIPEDAGIIPELFDSYDNDYFYQTSKDDFFLLNEVQLANGYKNLPGIITSSTYTTRMSNHNGYSLENVPLVQQDTDYLSCVSANTVANIRPAFYYHYDGAAIPFTSVSLDSDYYHKVVIAPVMNNCLIEYQEDDSYSDKSISISKLIVTNSVKTKSAKGKVDLSKVVGWDIKYNKVVFSIENTDNLFFRTGWFNSGKTNELTYDLGDGMTKASYRTSLPLNDVNLFVNDAYKWSDTEKEKVVELKTTLFLDDKAICSGVSQIVIKNNQYHKPVKKQLKTVDISRFSVINKNDVFLRDAFTQAQLDSIEKVLLVKQGLGYIGPETYREVGYVDSEINKMLDKKFGIKDVKPGFYTMKNELEVTACSDKYRKITVKFMVEDSYFSLGDNSSFGSIGFGVRYEVIKGKNNVPEYLRTGNIASVRGIVNFKTFQDSLEKVVKNSLLDLYGKSYGNNLNNVCEDLFPQIVTDIIEQSPHATYSQLLWDTLYFPTKNVRVKCPVDVYFYDVNGNLCASVVDNAIEKECENIDVTVSGDEKNFLIYGNDYNVKIVAYGQDTMTVEIEDYSNGDEKVKDTCFDDVSLYPGDEFTMNIPDDYHDSEYVLVKNETEKINADSTQVYTHQHSYVSFDCASTCDVKGISGSKCSTCGDLIIESEKELINHVDTDVDGLCDWCNLNISSTTGTVEDFAERLYTTCLGRDAEAAGKDYWVGELKGGKPGSEVAEGFFFSPEFIGLKLDNTEYITRLYRTFMGREPDQDGISYWSSELRSGKDRKYVFDGFVNSPEWADICLTYGIRSGGLASPTFEKDASPAVKAFAERLYTTCLGREAEKEGLEWWAAELANLRQTGTVAAQGFFFSPEFVGYKTDDKEFVTRLYRTFMGREPEKDGFDFWVGELKSGKDRQYVFDGFSVAPEFRNICAEAGIIA